MQQPLSHPSQPRTDFKLCKYLQIFALNLFGLLTQRLVRVYSIFYNTTMFEVNVISMVTLFNNHGARLYINILGGPKVWGVSSSVDGGRGRRSSGRRA